MQTLQMDEATARRFYPNADPALKEIFEQSFGKKAFSLDITERVKDFNDILTIAGKTMADMEKPGDTLDEIAYRQAKLIAKVYNEGDELNAFNTNQYKYFPWHKVSGSGLSCVDFGIWLSTSDVGVRLCFKNEKLAIDAGKKFLDIYTNLKTK